MDLIYNYAYKLVNSDDLNDQALGNTLTEAFGEVRVNVIKSCYKKLLLQSLKNGTNSGSLQNIYNVSLAASPPPSAPFKLITINLDNKIVLDQIRGVFDYTLKMRKCFIDEFWFCIEQRGDNIENTFGFHIHMLIKLNKHKAKSYLVNEMYNYFKRYITAKNYIDVKDKVYTPENVINYMSGQKEDSKLDKVKIDHIIHNKLSIPHVSHILLKK